MKKNIQHAYVLCPTNIFEIYRVVKLYPNIALAISIFGLSAIWIDDNHFPPKNTSLVKNTSLLP